MTRDELAKLDKLPRPERLKWLWDLLGREAQRKCWDRLGEEGRIEVIAATFNATEEPR